MAVLPIITGAETPVLRSKTVPVPKVTKEIRKLIKDMYETVHAAEGGGLAAPQIGITHRLCLAAINGRIIPLINPEILVKSNATDTMQEGCLSLPGLWIDVPRAKEIHLTYKDENGKRQERKLTGWDARVVQHEVDHLDGVLIVDYQLGEKRG
ncbi:MAG: peptide deformylase [Candidatus Peribacteraceae bacterium]|nr:peptide deformylase [Candidatus Peribacteraceae bacterium]